MNPHDCIEQRYKNKYFPGFRICACSKFKDNLLNGFGVLYYRNGNICYEGYWVNNRRHGSGISYDIYGNLEYDGDWYYDSKQGLGLEYYDKGCSVNNNTMFHNKVSNKQELVSKYYNNTVIKYNGTFHNNQRHGTGQLFSQDYKIVYSGQWYNGKKNGKGTSYKSDGNIEFSGIWVDDQFQHPFSFNNLYKQLCFC